MDAVQPRTVVIAKEQASFWMDARGRWCNVHGPFENPKIIAYFNACICKDEHGYHVCQQMEDAIEKVYFRYEDTALFVVAIEWAEDVLLTLNSGQVIALADGTLKAANDQLYLHTDAHRIKFSERCLRQLVARIQEKDGACVLITAKGPVPISFDAHPS